jgi:hypothetical protein
MEPQYVDENGVYRRTMDEAPRPVPVEVAPEPVVPSGPSAEELAKAEAELADLMAQLDQLKHAQESK